MTDTRRLVDQALDATVFAPLELLLAAGEHVPELAQKGRQRFAQQLPVARMIGEMAVGQAVRSLRSVLDDVRRQAEVVLGGSGPGDDEPGTTPDVTRGPPPSRSAGTPPGGAPASVVSDGAAPRADDLPIPGYDSLSASQVVQRLPGLSAEELDAVGRYEQAGRGRRTVLARVDQLRAAG